LPLAPAVPEFRDSAALHRAQMLALLAQPETRALLQASRRVGDSLRPLCWMLGIEFSVLYPARPDPARPAAGATDGSIVGSVSPAPAADNAIHDPAPDETSSRAVATMRPMMSFGGEPPEGRSRAREGGDFFATA
jgi:hypothetical protein